MKKYEAVVIGTGFGGAVNGCRLSKKWPGRVLILERGKRYPKGSFPRSPHDMSKNFWNVPEEDSSKTRPKKLSKLNQTGLFDIRNYKNMDVVISAGLGGGSLIYANVFLEPPDHIFDERWPANVKKKSLTSYYKIVKEILGSRPIPTNNDPRRKIVRTELYQKFAKSVGRESKLADINVFFGNDFKKPIPIGLQEKNRYGAVQTSCTYCAECDIGCNTHSKNTLDLNYLFVAENKYKAEVRTEHLVQKIVPLGPDGSDNSSYHGENGYRIYFRDLSAHSRDLISVITKRVVVSAGTLGSTELLLRCKEEFKTLPDISNHLGKQFSGNGDFLSFAIKGKEPANPNYGPVITQYTDYNLFKSYDPKKAFILQDASYPVFASYFAEASVPWFLRIGFFFHMLGELFKKFLNGKIFGKVGYLMSELMKGDLSYTSAVLLCMGIDRADGEMILDRKRGFEIQWPQKNSMSLYEAILGVMKAFASFIKTDFYFPLPTWSWPVRNNVSVHPLGGCILGNSITHAVTSADSKTFGQVFSYQGLYVADGSLSPTAIGANPSMTIAALAEKIAEGITGIKPTANL
ncbi:GMC oxidoreductase [Leptospira borgpetersenii]|uniref:GMC oxidoreductase n=1 Tax=Leptospira borgpetersenii TaxID=174 RepID=UPI000773CB99|nr:GMC oxidoreductase [Leptospira borgpetersenii]MBE8399375.1 GMC family oxidoreductase [Leptospira borgpetersenii serovar Tarassovi]MBE8402158.1 GMC family oxidoreductase [Leptospira borgpetersenii serovar Tarassovi]MBE8405068.1 GMC family oxidoreductase [Leptospira borgpetersenii serovar Tarassovi]MBE8411379.1 GMC family oxidoreductase [Leptospira borgpetersenii serovar Tarassovi]MBE8415382.1 GMC family oxidoreductase [Leptospira borgpetersenii serovar Tarassovi]